jgi:hypothetical protein
MINKIVLQINSKTNIVKVNTQKKKMNVFIRFLAEILF